MVIDGKRVKGTNVSVTWNGFAISAVILLFAFFTDISYWWVLVGVPFGWKKKVEHTFVDEKREFAKRIADRYGSQFKEEQESLDKLKMFIEKDARLPLLHLPQGHGPGHITASAFLVDSTRRKALLLKHKKLDRWLQPGGHVEEEDATLRCAARRELLEETGISLSRKLGSDPFDVDVHEIPARGDEPAHYHYDIRFLFEVDAGGAAVAKGGEGHELKWIPITELVDWEDKSIARMAAKIVRLYH